MLSDIISTFSSLGWDLVNGFKDLFVYIKDTTLSEAYIFADFEWFSALMRFIVESLGWGDVTILSLLVGGGFSLLVIVTIVKWVIGIIM